MDRGVRNQNDITGRQRKTEVTEMLGSGLQDSAIKIHLGYFRIEGSNPRGIDLLLHVM